jgi:hypothetical protein
LQRRLAAAEGQFRHPERSEGLTPPGIDSGSVVPSLRSR